MVRPEAEGARRAVGSRPELGRGEPLGAVVRAQREPVGVIGVQDVEPLDVAAGHAGRRDEQPAEILPAAPGAAGPPAVLQVQRRTAGEDVDPVGTPSDRGRRAGDHPADGRPAARVGRVPAQRPDRVVGAAREDVRLAVEPPLRDDRPGADAAAEVLPSATAADVQVVVGPPGKDPDRTAEAGHGDRIRPREAQVLPRAEPAVFVAPTEQHVAVLAACRNGHVAGRPTGQGGRAAHIPADVLPVTPQHPMHPPRRGAQPAPKLARCNRRRLAPCQRTSRALQPRRARTLRARRQPQQVREATPHKPARRARRRKCPTSPAGRSTAQRRSP